VSTAQRHIYIIGTESGPFKIGVATNLRDRLGSIQTGSHCKLAIMHSVPVEYADAILVERYVHKKLHAFRLSGEWFNVSLDDAKAALSHALSMIEEHRVKRDRVKEAQRAGSARVRQQQVITVHVPDVQLVHRVTLEEKLAEDARIKRLREAPRKAFSQKMMEGKRRKAAQLTADTAALQDWLSSVAAKR
jgi:hypothetical protein